MLTTEPNPEPDPERENREARLHAAIEAFTAALTAIPAESLLSDELIAERRAHAAVENAFYERAQRARGNA